MASLWKLLALVALLATAFAMGAAPAAAAPHHAVAAAVPMRHCPDDSGKAGMKGGVPECAMACAAALPAADLERHQPLMILGPLVQIPLAQLLVGLHPETDPPPPKGS